MKISHVPNSANQRSANERYWDWRAALLIALIVVISSMRLAVTNWTPFLDLTQTMGFLGVILGLALGYSQFSRKAIIRLSAGYTLLLLPANLLNAIERTDSLWQDILSLLNRQLVSFIELIQNQPVSDQLFFISVVALIYWIIGMYSGYQLIRHGSFLNVVLPSGLAIMVVQAFDWAEAKHIWEMAAYIFVSMLLMGRMRFLHNRSFWRQSHFLITEESINDLERVALVITAIAVFVSWSLPGWINAMKPAAQTWHDISQPVLDKFSNAVSALDSPYAGSGAGGDFYGTRLTLGQQAATSETPMFTIDMNKKQFFPVRSYWRGRVYDFYSNGHWSTTSTSSVPFLPTIDELTVENPKDQHRVEYTFTNNRVRQNLLYLPAGTTWVSTQSNVVSLPNSAGVKDVIAWVTAQSLSSGNQYKVRALIADPNVEDLRAAGTQYPRWVSEKYLEVPKEINPQLKELALQITQPYETVYDKTQAITSYLRNEITYTSKIADTLPRDKDPVLWVLFDYKKGFCMYYASAEVLMLRSIGIPARMAVGFAEGTFSEINWRYTVVYKDSHAWPEVYFPGIGWVEFEPTSNQPPVNRPEKKDTPDATPTVDPNAGNLAATPSTPVPARGRNEPPEPEIASRTFLTKSYLNALILILVACMAGVGIYLTRRYSVDERLPVYLISQYEKRGNTPPSWLHRWARWANLLPIERTFQTINLCLSWLGHQQPRHVTSQGRAEVLIRLLPSAKDQILLLLQEYQTAIYTPRQEDVPTARKAALTILKKTLQLRYKEALKFVNTRYN